MLGAAGATGGASGCPRWFCTAVCLLSFKTMSTRWALVSGMAEKVDPVIILDNVD